MFVAITLCSVSAFAEERGTLFNGKDIEAWKPSGDNAQFAFVDGVIVGTSSGQTQFLNTVETYGDFELGLEVKLHDTDLNSGIQIRTQLTRTNDAGKVRSSVHGPQVDLGKSPGRSGHIFNQGNGAWITPKKDLSRNEVMVNGKQVADVTDDEAYAKYPSGVIALQVHGVKKSPEKARQASFRSIHVRRIESVN